MEKILAVFDSDIVFATRLIEFIQNRKYEYEVCLFTKQESLEEFIKEHEIEILLIDIDLMKEDIHKEKNKNIYLLINQPQTEKSVDYPLIFKYQSAPKLMEEMMNHYMKNKPEENISRRPSDINIITLFTPSPQLSKLAYAWSMGISLASIKRVLFLPLELLPISILSIEDHHEQSISEFLYYLKENNPSIILKMKSLLNKMNNLNYLSGLTHGFDMLSLDQQDINKWVDGLRKNSEFEVVIFYTSFYSEAILELMKESNQVLLISMDNLYDKALFEEWKRQMGLLNIPIDSSKYHNVILPDQNITDGKELSLSLQELSNSSIWSIALQYTKELDICRI